MSDINYVKARKILLQEHPTLDERWVQDRIAEDPGWSAWSEVWSLTMIVLAVHISPQCHGPCMATQTEVLL